MQVSEGEVSVFPAVVRAQGHAARVPLQASAAFGRNALWQQPCEFTSTVLQKFCFFIG